MLPKADILPQFGGMLRDIPKKETTPIALRWMNDVRSATGLYQGFFTISCEFFFPFLAFQNFGVIYSSIEQDRIAIEAAILAVSGNLSNCRKKLGKFHGSTRFRPTPPKYFSVAFTKPPSKNFSRFLSDAK